MALAAHHLRLFALLLDYLFIVAGLKLAEQAQLGADWDLRLATSVAALFPPWWIAAVVLLFVFKDIGGASPGKWVMGIAVRRADDPHRGSGPFRAVLRNLALLLLPAEVYLVFRDPYWRRLGDRWAGTVVVVRKPEFPLIQRAFGLSILFLGFILVALLVTPWNLRRSAAYRVAYQAATAHPPLARDLGAPVTLDRTPAMELSLEHRRARLVFDAKGARGRAEVRVHLLLPEGTGSVWAVSSIDVEPAAAPGRPVQQAAPPPR
jgi:hypothetical protein